MGLEKLIMMNSYNGTLHTYKKIENALYGLKMEKCFLSNEKNKKQNNMNRMVYAL